jgi:succinyl-diaminopimelate desuccinylase
VWGRGAQDDKGPAAAIFSALDAIRALQRSEPRLRQTKSIRLLLGTREETDEWPDIDLLSRNELPPDFVVVPDGAFPVVNAEKGMVNLELTAAWPVALPEKPDVRVVSFDGGERGTTVPDRAVLRLEALDNDKLMDEIEEAKKELDQQRPGAQVSVREVMVEEPEDHVEVELVFTGHAAHAAFPEKGQNAVLDGLCFLLRIPGIPAHVAHFASALWEGCRHLDGSGLGLNRIHTYMGKTTLNLGMLRIWEAGAKAEVNVRFPAGIESDEVEQRFGQRFQTPADEALDVQMATETLGRIQAPIYLDPEEHHDVLDPLTVAYESVTGRSGGFVAMRGTTYAKAFPLAAAFGPVDVAAGDRELAHEPDERVSVARYLENVSIYATALLLLAFDLEP